MNIFLFSGNDLYLTNFYILPEPDIFTITKWSNFVHPSSRIAISTFEFPNVLTNGAPLFLAYGT